MNAANNCSSRNVVQKAVIKALACVARRRPEKQSASAQVVLQGLGLGEGKPVAPECLTWL
jgi:hypothetical protein